MQKINKMKASLFSVMLLLMTALSAQAQLNGTYTVYGAGADYPDLSSAVAALNAGVSGPVIFNIRPGTWSSSSTSRANLGNVSGASATNTITFQAENGNAATTIVRNTSTSSSTSSNHIFYFNSARYIKVRNLTLRRSHSSRACAVRFAGSAQYNTVENCIIDGGGTSTSSSNYRIYGTSLTNAHHNTIKNNSIDEGYYGIYWRGNGTTSLSSDNVITGNTLTHIYRYGIYSYYTNNHEVSGNHITSDRTNTTFYGVYSYYGDGGFKFDDNTIIRSGVTTSGFYPMYIYYGDATSSNRGSISGNTINITSSTTSYGMRIYYCNYYSINDNNITVTGSGTKYPIYNYNYNSNTGFQNGKDCEIDGNTIVASTTNSSIYMYGHYYYQKNPKFNNNTITTTTGSGSTYLYLSYYYQFNPEFNGNKITISGTSGYKYVFANYYYGEQGFEYNDNDITFNTTSGRCYNYAAYYPYYNQEAIHMNNNKVTMNATSSAYIYNYFGYYNYNSSATGNEMKGNEIYMYTPGSGAYNYMGYYFDGLDLSNNDVHVQSSRVAYGIYSYGKSSGSNPWNVQNNNVKAIGGSSTVYGFYNYYAANATVANNVVYAKGNSTCYGYLGGYNNGGGARYYNNTIHTEGTSTNYTFYCYATSNSQKATVRNNVFSRRGGNGYLMYGYQPQFYDMDYNNLWNNGSAMWYFGGLGQSYGSISAIRNGTGQHMNSLSYNPGFYSTTTGDLRPDPSNPNSWSLNGRGVQLPGNGTDINGNPRALTTVQGVPDIGAYEFTPTSTPPNCTMTPAAPSPSGTQTVTFGEDTVAVLHWGAVVPSNFAVKQYTGTNPPGITSINPTQMFYYADFLGTGTNLDYQQDLYFKEPWLGSIASKSALRLAEKVGSGGWTGYSPANSVSNIVRNYIETPSVMDVGALFTGIDVGNNASADAIIEPLSPFCPGTYNVKLRITNVGNNTINNVKIAWELGGVPKPTITHTSPIHINGSSQGNEAIIDLGPVTFGAAAVNIKAWTFEPNGVQDPIPSDDTLEGDYFAALGGVYTVGGTNPDFPTVIAAAAALNQYGTCGDVYFDIRPGTYTGKVELSNPVPVPNTQGRVTFRSENNNPASVIITAATSTADYAVIQLNAADNFTFKNITVNTATSYGHCFGLWGASDNDSIVGCVLNAPTAISASYNNTICAYQWYTGFNGSNLVVQNNKMNGGYISMYCYPSSYQSGIVIDNNEIKDFRVYGLYTYYTHGIEITNNTIEGQSGYNANYGIMAYYAQQGPKIMNNRVSQVYYSGLYMYYPHGTSTNRAQVRNNSIITKSGTQSYYPVYMIYPTYTDIMHNTVVNNGSNSSTYYGAYINLNSYSNNKIYNNVFANLAGGYAAYIYYLNGYNNEMDFNNLYTTSNSLFVRGQSTYGSLAAWRSATPNGDHSLTYDPAITSATDPTPDVTNPAVWAMNGHGLQMAGDVSDIDGKTRPDVRPDGVPDLGAFEIVPEVMPPAATATPAVADKGTTQVFTFAGNEVGRITWGYNAPVPSVTVHQYSGERAGGVAAAAAPSGSMYFHTDIVQQGIGTSHDFSFNLDYKDIWLGDIPNDNNLRLAHKVTGYPWMVYSGSLSTIDAATNDLDAADLNRLGAFTALENNAVPSSFARPQGGTIICIGNSVTINAEPNNGDYYKWSRNGVAIPGAEGANYKSYTATTAGDYSVAITFTGKIVESVPVTVSTIAAPNAIINASGPLTYCTGSGLTLDAGSTTGVTYQWQLNGNDIPNATNSTYAVGQAGQYTVVTTNIGCSSVSTATPITAGPIKVDLGNDTSYCEIKNVYMKLDAGFVGAKYLWNTGDTSRVIEVKQGGKYSVRVDGGPNCIGTDDIQVTIDPLPKANGISFVQNGNDYQFFASGAVGATGFLWLFSDGTTSTMPQPSKTLKTEDLYVRLVMFNACGSDTVQLGWPLSVSAIAEGEGVRIYPNPATTQVTIDAGTVNMESVEILNSVGAVVYRASDMNTTKHSADISTLANGHYMMRATTESGTLTKQFDVLK